MIRNIRTAWMYSSENSFPNRSENRGYTWLDEHNDLEYLELPSKYQMKVKNLLETDNIEKLVNESKPTAEEYIAWLEEEHDGTYYQLIESANKNNISIQHLIDQELNAYFFLNEANLDLHYIDTSEKCIIKTFNKSKTTNFNTKWKNPPNGLWTFEFIWWWIDLDKIT